MTREVLDVLPTGRNIQAVGIMIPGTNLAVGGGGALSRDVGGSGSLQQSPLQYRGSGDTVQTIEGLRLNNLEAQGQYSGVYWNDASFEELSYITGADSAEMGQGGIRVNMVPRDGGNAFRGQIFANFADGAWASDNCGSPGVGQPCTRSNLSGSTVYNPNNRLTNVSEIQQVWDVNPSLGGPLFRDKVWFHYTFRHWGVDKTIGDSYFDSNPSQFVYEATPTAPASTTAISSATPCACHGRRPARTSSPSITTTRASTGTTGASARPCRPKRRASRSRRRAL